MNIGNLKLQKHHLGVLGLIVAVSLIIALPIVSSGGNSGTGVQTANPEGSSFFRPGSGGPGGAVGGAEENQEREEEGPGATGGAVRETGNTQPDRDSGNDEDPPPPPPPPTQPLYESLRFQIQDPPPPPPPPTQPAPPTTAPGVVAAVEPRDEDTDEEDTDEQQEEQNDEDNDDENKSANSDTDTQTPESGDPQTGDDAELGPEDLTNTPIGPLNERPGEETDTLGIGGDRSRPVPEGLLLPPEETDRVNP